VYQVEGVGLLEVQGAQGVRQWLELGVACQDVEEGVEVVIWEVVAEVEVVVGLVGH
jgi:hypothetical protein